MYIAQQIRNHLQWLGFPIANDPNYGDAATVAAFKGQWGKQTEVNWMVWRTEWGEGEGREIQPPHDTDTLTPSHASHDDPNPTHI